MIEFFKYQGTGNDFVIIDNRQGAVALSKDQVAFLCDRKFGIGADGLMLLGLKDGYDFSMTYYNSDGAESSMCGNGGRCIVSFAQSLNIISLKAFFIAIDGEHEARIFEDRIELNMTDVMEITPYAKYTVLHTGSPHCIQFTTAAPKDIVDFVDQARSIRNTVPFKEEGINVNFVFPEDGQHLSMRTFERGVEGETLSCGTGAVAAAIASHYRSKASFGSHKTEIATPGGSLTVSFDFNRGAYTSVKLIGPARCVFKGQIALP